MYRIEITTSARNDIYDIFNYISNELNNISAANKLKIKLFKEINNISIFPFGSPIVYINFKSIYKYRSLKVKNYSIFYTVNEELKVITIVRVLYSKRDFNSILK